MLKLHKWEARLSKSKQHIRPAFVKSSWKWMHWKEHWNKRWAAAQLFSHQVRGMVMAQPFPQSGCIQLSSGAQTTAKGCPRARLAPRAQQLFALGTHPAKSAACPRQFGQMAPSARLCSQPLASLGGWFRRSESSACTCVPRRALCLLCFGDLMSSLV